MHLDNLIGCKSTFERIKKMPNKKRSFRITETQAELIITAICYFCVATKDQEQWAAHNKALEKIAEKLTNYKWEVEQ